MIRQYDIVIPLYNGLHFFRDCYESVKRYSAPQHTLLIVNDGSTERELLDYLQQIAADPATVILNLPVNRGFVHAVNQGLRYSRNDVVLLNSDTEVTPRWLEKLDAALDSSPNVGTATPWTNKGTICSLPRFCEDNELPEGCSADELSEMAETVSAGLFLHLPTAVGFCMAIRRQLIDEVGLFDEESYGRGYCEENDFCMRAKEVGYVNIIDDRTFILHKGSMTFAGEKEKVLDKHLKKLITRHPQYLSLVMDFIERDPLFHARSRINRLIEHRAGKVHVLFLLHNDPTGGWAIKPGGTEYHVLDLAEALYCQGQVVPFIMASSGKELLLLEKNQAGVWQRSRIALDNRIDISTAYDRCYRDRLLEVLDIYHIDVLHVHQLVHSPSDLAALLGGWSGAVLFTLHDFYTVCPSYNLLTPENSFCGYSHPERCPSCIQQIIGFRLDLGKWQGRHVKNFQRADAIYVPSESCKSWIVKAYAGIADKLMVREHGSQRSGVKARKPLRPGQRLRVGFVGGLTRVKGSGLIREIIRLDSARQVEWTIIGQIGDPDLQCMEQENVKKIGRYHKEELAGLLNKAELQLMVLCSIWPETFSYTLSECWDVGLPVLTGPVGAPADRVRRHGGGWLTEELSAAAFWQAICDLLVRTDEYERVAAEVNKVPMMTIDKMAGLYQADYLRLAIEKNLSLFRPECDRPFWPGRQEDAMTDAKGASVETIVAERDRYRAERDHLYDTLSWRITAPLRNLGAFFKKKTREKK